MPVNGCSGWEREVGADDDLLLQWRRTLTIQSPMSTRPATLRAIVYVSTAKQLMDGPQLEDLLAKSRALNVRNGITGVLLYNLGSFMQYIEGESAAVDETYSRILSCIKHHNVIELVNGPIDSRNFDAWAMGLADPKGSELLALSTAQWSLLQQKGRGGDDGPLGLAMLRKFWASSSRRAAE